MSERKAANLTVPDLVDEFRQLAVQLGSAWDFSKGPDVRRTPERAARVARMNALTPEMRLRAPAETLKTLMEDADDDVRAWAAMRFDEAIQTLRTAAISGICEGVSTQGARSLIEHGVRRRRRVRP